MSQLFKIKGFLAFILIVFINAFVDLGHKIIIQNTVLKVYSNETQIILTAIVNGLILLPFILLFTPSGYLSDHFHKPKVMKISAFIAIIITLFITLSYYKGWFYLSFALTLLLAIQSALYSPAKYGYIAEIAGKSRLSGANALVQASTVLAILSGIFCFSVLFESFLTGFNDLQPKQIIQQIAPIGWILVALSCFEWLLTFRLPQFSIQQNKKAYKLKQYVNGAYLKSNLKIIFHHEVIWLSIIGLAVFWSISQVIIAVYPAYAKAVLNTDNTIIIQGILASTGIGIVFGSLLAGRLSKQYIETALIPLGAIGFVITVFSLPYLTTIYSMVGNFMLLGIFGGLFIVPLNALIQFHCQDQQRGTILAGNNWIQNIAMLSFLILTALFSYNDFNERTLLQIISFVALIGTLYTIYKLPQSLVRYLTAFFFSSRYKVQVQGFDKIPSQGGVLLLGNHISWLDWAILQIACPRPVRYVMHRTIYKKWYLKWFFDFFGVIPISGGHSKTALTKIGNLLKQGEVVCLFPEGSISRNGQLGEFKKGYELAVKELEETDAVIVPFYLRGLWGTFFSRSNERLQQIRKQGWRNDVIVAFAHPISIKTTTVQIKSAVFDLSIEAWQEHTRCLEDIPHAWISQVKREPKRRCLIEAKGGLELNAISALTGAIGFSKLIKKNSPEQNIGLLVPTSVGGLLVNMAALIGGKTVVNLNYTANINALISALHAADLKTIYTSSQFIKKLNQRGIDLTPLLDKVKVLYLEDLKQQISTAQKIRILLSIRLFSASVLKRIYCASADLEKTAAILFSSGSEGKPKGVMLSHRNMIANIKQVSDVMDPQNEDVLMATLPLFHAFGITVTGIMPLLEGVPVVTHPDPTDVVNISKAIAQNKATLFCATSTFLRFFIKNKRVHPLMLADLRLVIAGAERLNPEVREAFKLKFNKEIYEGYGTTECTPVASVNIQDRLDTSDWRVQIGQKIGTVGLPLPGSSFRIVDPNSMQTLEAEEDGLILIGGTQVMQGYLNDPEKTAEVIIELDGVRWYKTGDKGHLDRDGFLTIIDRYSRFAKIGGEMISLGAIEQNIMPKLNNEDEILAIAIRDEKKGEKVVLLYVGESTEADINEVIKQADLNTLSKPSKIIKVEVIPKLGTGKTDFNQAKQLVLDLVL